MYYFRWLLAVLLLLYFGFMVWYIEVREKTPKAAVVPQLKVVPVAPMPREKEVRCTCIYCSCTQPPFKGEEPRECVCDEQRCKKNNCNCNKWEKK
jgi:predicted outer membrane lipoprotein